MYLCYFLLEVVSSPQSGLKGYLITQLHGLVPAQQVQVDSADFVLGALPPSQALLSGTTGGTRGHSSWSRFLPFTGHFHTGYLLFLAALSYCLSLLN